MEELGGFDVQTFIESSKAELSRILKELGWTREGLLDNQKDDESLVECQYDRSHKVKPSKMEDHELKCKMRKAGYDSEDMEGAVSMKFCYENASSVHSIEMDEKIQNEVINNAAGSSSIGTSLPLQREIPLTLERAQSTLTPTERLAVYDYCVQRAKEARKLVRISDDELMFLSNESKKRDEDDNQRKSYLEILAEERDYKRRRQSYRAKNVHTTKKSQTEIIREVINNQMEILEQMWKDDKTQIQDRLSTVTIKQEPTEDISDRNGERSLDVPAESSHRSSHSQESREKHERVDDSSDRNGERSLDVSTESSRRSSHSREIREYDREDGEIETSRSHRSSRESSPRHKKKRKDRSRSRSRDRDRRHSKKHKKHKHHHKDKD